MSESIQFTFNASWLVKKQIIAQLKKGAFLQGIDIDIKAIGGGWLEKEYGVTATGDREDLKRFLKALVVYKEVFNEELERIEQSKCK